METYKCAYRDLHSPLTPLAPICDNSLRQTLRDHSPSLIPKIVLDDCPPPKKKRSTTTTTTRTTMSNTNSKNVQQANKSPCHVNIVVSSERTPPGEVEITKSSYLRHLRRVLTPTSRLGPKLMDFGPSGLYVPPVKKKVKPKFTCFPKSPRRSQLALSPRVLRMLKHVGQEKYSDLFRKEEIDFEVFKMLTRSDLMKLGIHEEQDLPEILNAIKLVRSW